MLKCLRVPQNCDADSAEAVASVEEFLGPAYRTLQVDTKRGRHWYVLWPDGEDFPGGHKRKTGPFVGCDIRWSGSHQQVGPGSPGYALRDASVPAAAPSRLVAELGRKVRRTRAEKHWETTRVAAEKSSAVRSTVSRHPEFLKAAYLAHMEGAPAEAVVAAVREVNAGYREQDRRPAAEMEVEAASLARWLGEKVARTDLEAKAQRLAQAGMVGIFKDVSGARQLLREEFVGGESLCFGPNGEAMVFEPAVPSASGRPGPASREGVWRAQSEIVLQGKVSRRFVEAAKRGRVLVGKNSLPTISGGMVRDTVTAALGQLTVEQLQRTPGRSRPDVLAWDREGLVAFGNGKVFDRALVLADPKSDGVRKEREEDLVSRRCPLEPQAGSTARFDRLLLECADGDQGMARGLFELAVRAFLREPDQHVHFAVGEGQNGKGAYCLAVEEVIGKHDDGGMAARIPPEWRNRGPHPAWRERLRGAGFLFADETAGTYSRYFPWQQVLEMTGGSPMPSRRMRQDYGGDVVQSWTMMLPVNRVPMAEPDTATKRRVVVWPFDRVVSEKDKDPFLQAKIAAEAPAILAKMLKRAAELVRAAAGKYPEALRPSLRHMPAKVRKATERAWYDINAPAAFVKERCRKASVLVTLEELQERFAVWCEKVGIADGTERDDEVRARLGKAFARAGYKSRKQAVEGSEDRTRRVAHYYAEVLFDAGPEKPPEGASPAPPRAPGAQAAPAAKSAETAPRAPLREARSPAANANAPKEAKELFF